MPILHVIACSNGERASMHCLCLCFGTLCIIDQANGLAPAIKSSHISERVVPTHIRSLSRIKVCSNSVGLDRIRSCCTLDGDLLRLLLSILVDNNRTGTSITSREPG